MIDYELEFQNSLYSYRSSYKEKFRQQNYLKDVFRL